MRKSSGQKVTSKKKMTTVKVAAMVIAAAIVIVAAVAVFRILGIFGTSSGDVEVPKIIGMTIEEAREQYPDFEIVCTDSAVDETVDLITEQSPEAHMRVKEDNQVIKVKVENGSIDTIEIEDYRGLSGDDVQEELENLGLKVTVKEQSSDTVEEGLIVRQSLSEGRKVSRGTKITLYVSNGTSESTGDADEDTEEEETTVSATSTPRPTASTPTATPSSTSASSSSEGSTGSTAKSTYLTVYGPTDKDSALVQVRVNGTVIYSENLQNGASDMVRIVGSSDTANVEILHDGVVVQQSTVNLN